MFLTTPPLPSARYAPDGSSLEPSTRFAQCDYADLRIAIIVNIHVTSMRPGARNAIPAFKAGSRRRVDE